MGSSVSDHFNGRTFFNPGAQINNNMWRFLNWQKARRKNPWPKHVPTLGKPIIGKSVQPDEVYATFVNHATYLLQVAGLNVLTDPVFSKRVGPLPGIGVRRTADPGVPFAELPPIHLVVISHNHYDHLDIPTLRRLARVHNPLFVVPLGNGRYIRKAGSQNIQELDWWQTHKISNRDAVTLVPVQHWSGRGLHDRFQALWGGYVLNNGGWKTYFAGDTGYGPHFKSTQEHFGGMDLSLLPIGAYEPRSFMRPQHMDPEHAVQAHIDLGSKQSLAMHFGTFHLSDEGYDEPPRVLKKAIHAHPKISPDSFRAPHHGETFRFTIPS